MSTTDRRRLPGPEVSFPPIYAPLDPTPSSSKLPREGRRDEELREIFLKTGLISQANGSGYIECGSVKIACAVYGPRPKPPPYSPQGTLNLEIKFAPFASHPRRAPLRDTEPPHLHHLLLTSLSPLLLPLLPPKTTLDIHLLILQSESPSLESTLSAGLTVASAAVADAGVGMLGLGVGVAGVLGEEGGVKLDPEGEEAREARGRVTVGCVPALGEVTDVWMTGELEVGELIELINKSVKGSAEAHTKLGRALIDGAQERAAKQVV